MKLCVENLGAIGKGTIDLSKKFTLLCGPNGTGKTYFAFAVYGLLRNQLIVKSDESLANRLLNNKYTNWAINYDDILTYREALRKTLIKRIGELFGLGDIDCEKNLASFNVNYGESEEEFVQKLKETEIDSLDFSIHNIDIRIKKKSHNDNVEIYIQNDTISSDSISDVRLSLLSMLLHNLCLYPIRNVVIFPVERNSIYTFSKELSIRKQDIVDSIQMLTSKEKKYDKIDSLLNTKRYSLPIKDGLVVAEDLVERKKTCSEFYEFAEKIETELLNGKVLISNDGEIQFKPKKAPKSVLPIQMTASIIKTMASLVVYLKHIAKKNDLIIIDEPEINLHPNNQLVLTRIFARLMNHGFRLLVSTHSDYIIREINNLVMISHTDNLEVKSLAQAKKYEDDEFIKKEDLSVLVFDYKNKSSKLVEVVQQPVDDFGFDIKSIDAVIEEQTDFTEQLYYALKYPQDNE